MLENFLQRKAAIERLRASLFGAHLDSFVATLSGWGYGSTTVLNRLRLLRSFDQWLRQRSLVLVDLREAVVNLFLAERRDNGRLQNGQAKTIRQFLDHLRARGVVQPPEPATDESPLATLIRQYENYLKKERGLAPKSIAHYRHFAQRFLVERFEDAPILIRDLVPDDISCFFLRHTRSGSPTVAKIMVAGMRSFLRFLFLTGQTESDLTGAVLTVPQRRHTDLPKYLTSEEVEQVVRACDGDRPSAARDRAILLLLARLGLRAGEVTALELDDVDWRVGELKVRDKGGQHDRLPLPVDVGEAMADYLRHHRPPCATRRFFVRAQPPYQGFSRSSVGTVVRRAIDRVGLHANCKGAHVLRHSLATGMLRSGASLAEIGGVLRHRAVTSTAIYAKIDVMGLRSLALPWPTKEEAVQ
jgi:site-specific recombinase XerD